MLLPEHPHVIDKGIYHFDCSLKEISTYKVARNANGYVELPRIEPGGKKIVLLMIDCKDGLFVLLWEKDD